MKTLIEKVIESNSEPLSIVEYLGKYQTSKESLSYEIENELVLACFNWKRLRLNHEYEIRWHLESVAEVVTKLIDGKDVQIQNYKMSDQPYTNSCTQSDSVYANLVGLNPNDAKKLILKEVPFITLTDGMTIYPYSEYFTISHRLQQNKWYEAHLTLENLKFINLVSVATVNSIPTNYPSSAPERHMFNVMACLQDLKYKEVFNDLQNIPRDIKNRVIKVLSSNPKGSLEFSGEDSVKKAWQELSKSGQIAHIYKISHSKKAQY
ncbi:MAG: hypothetical protein ACJAS1_006459 [Oleiphilaceae bacterium]|jgi:hypothetical protein